MRSGTATPGESPPDGRSLVLATLCLGVLVAQIDTSVVNLALRPIGDALGVGVGSLQWTVDAYNLAYALFLLTGGLLGDLLGRRRIFIVGVVVFSLGCLVCGLAPDAVVLVLGRVLAGLGAALLIPASLAILRVVWPEPVARGRALGVWAGCNGLAFAIGPILGGVLIETLGWRSVFLIAIPPAALACLLAWRVVPESADPQHRSFDARGQLLAALALGAFAFAAIEGRLAPWLMVVAVPVAVFASVWFVRVERLQGDAALVPLDLFGIRAFRGACIATAAMTFGMYGLLFLVPLSWQARAGSAAALQPLEAGLALLPMAIAFVLFSRRSGPLVERFGARIAIAGGTGLIGLGLLTLASTQAARPMWLAQIGLVAAGVGMGINTGPLMGVAVAAVRAARSGTASSLINVARLVGATLGVAVLGALYARLGGGRAGLGVAMATGGLVQLAGATVAWSLIGAEDTHAPRR
jgi:EmrB/QacA subfamily drug resistance transporter